MGEKGIKIAMDYGGNPRAAGEILLFMTWEVIKDTHLVITNNDS